ncbi:thiol:disulfide interchange protein DsbA/DsbL [Halochromatium sp.]
MRRSPHTRRVLRLTILLLALLAVAPASGREDQALRYATFGAAQPSDRDEQIEIVQVFWYGCPSCGPLEDQLERLVAETDDDIVVRRMPAIAPRWEPHARAFYAAESIGALDLFHSALAEAMQAKPRQLMTDDELLDFAAEIGVDADAFRQAYYSPGVERRVQEAAELTRRYGITAVPALIINDKYRTDLQLAGDQEAMIEVSQRLIERTNATRSARGRNRGPR